MRNLYYDATLMMFDDVCGRLMPIYDNSYREAFVVSVFCGALCAFGKLILHKILSK